MVSNATFKICRDAFSGSNYSLQAWGVGIGTSIQFILLVGVAIWARRQNRQAQEDLEDGLISENSTPLVFQMYIYLLIMCAFAYLVEGIIHILSPYSIIDQEKKDESIYIFANAIATFLFHITMEGVAFLLMNGGLGINSIKRTITAVTLWAFVSFSFKFFTIQNAGEAQSFFLDIAFNAILTIFYFLIWSVPLKMCMTQRRPALHGYSLYHFLLYGLFLVSSIIRWQNLNTGYCLYIFDIVIQYVCSPWILYIALRNDSKFWQGLHVKRKESKIGGLRHALSGIVLSLEVARTVADEIDCLKVGTRLLNHAALKIDKTRILYADENSVQNGKMIPVLLGAGSNSKVFQGTYQGNECAIKMIYTPALTPDIVKTFCSEAALLGDLSHPHVVQIMGICINPPCICLVMELCSGGTLYNYVRENKTLYKDWNTQLRMAIECTKAVAFLHSQKPPILHLDLKSPNFLRSKYGVIKVADLELSKRVNSPDGDENSIECDFMVPDCVNWLAPELITHDNYDEKADIYSLACVFWEITTGKVPYEDFPEWYSMSGYGSCHKNKNAAQRGGFLEREMAKHIVEQTYRPPIPKHTHPEFNRLITAGWDSDPKKRPTAKYISECLQKLRRTVNEDAYQLADFFSVDKNENKTRHSSFFSCDFDDEGVFSTTPTLSA